MQTSIEWLIEKLGWYTRSDEINRIINEAKEMHKQEIIESYCQGCKDISEDDSIFPRETAEEYYQNLFGYKL